MPGTLYLVATPIGNLQDITLRALDVLKSVSVIACEDTRHTQKLLNHYEIKARTVSYHENNEAARADELGKRLEAGEDVAVVSDAGTPGINDPGYRIVERAIGIGAEVVPIPGAVSFVNAAIASGLATDSIFFGGFLPSRKGERRKRLQEAADFPATLVFFEAPHRLPASLADCAEVLGDRQACVAREITKRHEEFARGALNELARKYAADNVKGEIVLVIDRQRESTAGQAPVKYISIADRIVELESSGMDRKAALKQAAREYGVSRSEAYRLARIEK